jgi:5-oxoprolinase (ATP-hydrolysing)
LLDLARATGANATMSRWQFWIDRGGTFTDVVARAPNGAEVVKKLLSVNPERYQDAASEAIRAILAEHGGDVGDIGVVKLGTTVATNALLERKGADVMLVVTRGFGDALEIGVQARPEIFARHIVKPDLLHKRVIEARERVSAEGEVLEPLDEAHARAALQAAFDDGFRAIAIACLHAWAYPAHEQKLAALAHDIGYTQISVSSEISGLIKFVPRADTSVADAYLSPVLRAYIDGFAGSFRAPPELLFMQSSGGLARAPAFRGRDAVLSGPAGGVVGMAAAARQAGFSHALGFDMGGTSTDVSHYAGAFERTNETMVAGVRLSAPMLQVHTVAAGGGSICFFDGARLRVGPHSAGADPGPACYRRGGPLTITDCNVLLGRVQPEFFPAIFGPNADQPLDLGAVEEQFARLCTDIARQTGRALSPAEAAEGFLRIANENMAEAIKKISIQRGYNPTDYALVAFGGAGGQHACAVADAVGVNTILLHPRAGLLSAWGIGLADVSSIVEETIEAPVAAATGLHARVAALELHARESLADAGDVIVTANLKYEGADSTLPVLFSDAMTLQRHFRTAIGTQLDPILLEVFNNRFMGVAEEMGLALQTTASSVNIKERLDFSCAVFDDGGGLVANAPHIPVHLGSMSDSVREIMRQRGDTMRAGDIYMLNAPHAGGTHLPDITVIAPVILDGDARPGVLHRRARTSRRHWRHHARLNAARQHTHRRRRRADREFPIGARWALAWKPKRARCSRAALTPHATSIATLPILKRRSPRACAASMN